MSKGTVIDKIQREIQKINNEIDLRIINGEPYKSLARRHKRLLGQLWRMRGQSWLERSFRFLTLL